MENCEIIPLLEAVLFAVGEPIEIERLCVALELDEIIVEQALRELGEKYESDEYGICLLRLENRYQLCTKRKFADSIRSVIEVKKNAPLSQAAFEVLAIIAYNQPVTKAFVEQIRGVDCSGVISSLCSKSLIEEKGRLDLPGRPLIYGTTPEFLRCFCISSLDELPPLPEENSTKEDDAEGTEEKNEKNFSAKATDFEIKVDENQNLE
ncbi:MAG: SMC-Scp complex subunit ScpB [Oscillospiraceae bacterium]|nr:SMC-Scp complex subunit ScpB [Oscillospiraceae bacterium]